MKKCWPYIALVVAFVCLVASDKVWSMPYQWDVGFVPIFLILASVVLGVPSGLFLIFHLLRRLIKYAIPTLNDPEFLSLLWLGIMAIVVMFIYPPWVTVLRQGSVSITISAGYALLWQVPEGRFSVTLDLPRLSLQSVIVALITGGLLYTLRIRQRHGKQPGT